MLPLIAAGGLAALSIGSSIMGNKSNADAFLANTKQVYKDYDYQIKQLQRQMGEANDNIALEMSAKRWDALKLGASTTNTIVEKNIAGNTAARAYNSSALASMFAHNTLAKKAEDTMASFGYEMDNTRVNANNALYGYAAQAKKSQISTLGMVTSAAQAGMSGYAMASGLAGLAGGATGATGAAGAVGGSMTEAAGLGTSSVSMASGTAEISTPFTSNYFGG